MNVAPDCLVIGGHKVEIHDSPGAALFPRWRYCAIWKDYEPGDPIGYGPTPVAAADELKSLCDDLELK